MTVEKLLKVRAAIKKRKPTYKRVQAHQFAKLSETKWRKPKGMGNKVRRGRRGKPSMPQVGFGSPKATKFLNKAGLREVLVSNVSDLSNVNAKSDAVVIAGTVGGRKKLDILTEASKLKLNVANVKDVEASIKTLTKTPVAKKKETAKVEEKKATTKKATTDGGKSE